MAQARAITTRNTILVAAARVFDREGFAGASISDILQEANTTKGALYFHFKSKEALAAAIVEDHPSWITSNLPEHDNPIQSAIELSYRFIFALKLSPLVRASVRLALENPRFLVPDPDTYAGWISATMDLFSEAETKNLLLPGVSVETAANHFTASVVGCVIFSRAFTQGDDAFDRVHKLWKVSLPGITHPEVIESLQVSPPSEPPAIAPSTLEAGLEQQFQ